MFTNFQFIMTVSSVSKICAHPHDQFLIQPSIVFQDFPTTKHLCFWRNRAPFQNQYYEKIAHTNSPLET